MEIKILCVDDESYIRDLFYGRFEKSGLTFESARSAKEALEMLEEKNSTRQ